MMNAMAAEGINTKRVIVGMIIIVDVLDSKNFAAVLCSKFMKVAMIITDAITQRMLAEFDNTTRIYDDISLQSSSFESYSAGKVKVKNNDDTSASIS